MVHLIPQTSWECLPLRILHLHFTSCLYSTSIRSLRSLAASPSPLACESRTPLFKRAEYGGLMVAWLQTCILFFFLTKGFDRGIWKFGCLGCENYGKWLMMIDDGRWLLYTGIASFAMGYETMQWTLQNKPSSSLWFWLWLFVMIWEWDLRAWRLGVVGCLCLGKSQSWGFGRDVFKMSRLEEE